MTSFAKCLVADGRDIFCIHGKLFCLDTRDECLRYMRPCATCTKAATNPAASPEDRYRHHGAAVMNKFISAAVLAVALTTAAKAQAPLPLAGGLVTHNGSGRPCGRS